METEQTNVPIAGPDDMVSVFAMESVDTILDTLNGNITEQHSDETPIQATQQQESDTTEQADHVDPVVLMSDLVMAASDIEQHDDGQNLVMQPEENTRSAEDTLDEYENDFNIMNEESHDNESRFSGAQWFNTVKSLDILIAGIGGIGSYAAFLISRLQPHNIVIFDPDTVEEANLSGQLFSYGNISSWKTHAITSMIRDYSGYYNCSSFHERYTGQYTRDIMICGFDNMYARKTFFASWCNHVDKLESSRKKECLYIDGRLGLEELQVFSIRGDEDGIKDKYAHEYLFDDSEAEQVPCSMKQTSFMASMIGSIMTNILVNHAVDMESPIDVRAFPFITLYNAEDMRMQLKF